MGYNVLIPYLRAHGPSEGKYISFGPLEKLDLIGWIARVNERISGSILIHGLSMGGGIALDLATMELENVKCILADAPSYSVPGFFREVAQSVSKKKPDKVFDGFCRRFTEEFSADAADYDRLETIRNGRYPLMLTAGSLEGQEEILSILKERNPQPTTVLILPGCNHGNGMYKQTEMYHNAIREFAERYM
jgi:pimeloyl-ACP methyl ester carboxylesterase